MDKRIEQLCNEMLEECSKLTGLSVEYLKNAHISEIEEKCNIKPKEFKYYFPWERWDY